MYTYSTKVMDMALMIAFFAGIQNPVKEELVIVEIMMR